MSKRLTIAGDVCCDLDMTDEAGNYVREYEPKRHEQKVKANAAKHGVEAVMVEEEGPGGGHPVYEFTGTRAQLEAFVIEFYEAGQAHSESLEFYFEDAVEAD